MLKEINKSTPHLKNQQKFKHKTFAILQKFFYIRWKFYIMEILNFKGSLPDLIYMLKKGGSIHIKKKNRGKFTESAKRAGMGVQEYARHVLANKDKYSSTLVKRANFARNAKKFKHEDGGIINKFQPGGEIGYDITPAVVTQDSEFNKFLMTLPDNLRLTPEKDYYLYKSWKMNGKPRNFQEGLEANMYSWDDSDNSYHGVTIIGYDENGVGIFGKPKHHDTVHYELDWYNKGIGTLPGGKQYQLQGDEKKEWEDFRNQYQLDSTGVDYKYVPKYKNWNNPHIR